ncbi:hypothetical protein LEP1GSC073_0163 [Leptospira noguchii str. Cascata]|nr:hypothetical protein LEP1GSC073_0163 [Leptospira noguchii str. Cascata]
MSLRMVRHPGPERGRFPALTGLGRALRSGPSDPPLDP